MRIITTPKGGGKTAAMLEWMRAAPEGEHRVCVAFSNEEAMRLLRENRDLESWQFVGPDEPKNGGSWSAVLRGRGGRIVLGVDNVDLWLQRQFRFEVGAVSLTVDDPSHAQTVTSEDLAAADASQEALG